MLVMMKKTSNFFDFVDYQNVGSIMNFLSVFTHARDRCFFDVRVCFRLMVVSVKAMHTASQLILLDSLFSDVSMCLNGSGLRRTHKLLML